jgi:hypothetical protein
MDLQKSIEIVQSFRNWTNDASLPMTHTKGEVIEALDIVLGSAKLQKAHIDQYKPILDKLNGNYDPLLKEQLDAKINQHIIDNSQVSENHLQREHKIEANK